MHMYTSLKALVPIPRSRQAPSSGGNIAQEVVRRAPHRVHALVVADATCNTAARYPLAASTTVAALTSHARLPGDHFARHAAHTIAVDPQVQRYALQVTPTARTGRPSGS